MTNPLDPVSVTSIIQILLFNKYLKMLLDIIKYVAKSAF